MRLEDIKAHYPGKVICKDSIKKTTKKSMVMTFVKLVNYKHLMPTLLQSRLTALKEWKKRLEKKFKFGKNMWFFTKLGF
ncbi:hypothetical protein UlMin_020436 [Ulmus minor]